MGIFSRGNDSSNTTTSASAGATAATGSTTLSPGGLATYYGSGGTSTR